MAYPPDHEFYTKGVLRLVLVLAGLSLAGYIVGPSWYWRLEGNSTTQAPCPLCVCNCSSEDFLPVHLEIISSSLADCGKNDPDMKEEMKKDFVALLSEELNLRKAVANDTIEHSKTSVRDARKTFSHYRREAQKCSAGVETCEEARQRAERELAEEVKLSALWEKRAREHG
ncbi:uncharacterized protein LOC121261532 [Juglans microcarpa x Juglans regia]|uniref:uncharacterized protein LOC121261532 n=1 Tax=Juglans microcarpa x Juglans regia TaxID=2249226 RepID=UPI001B7F003D|nr:uncharacterized protein LOC121261532 [Juglans microcarpa x Juglans regia]